MSADGSTLVLDDADRVRVIRRDDGPNCDANSAENVGEWPPGATVPVGTGVLPDRVVDVARDGSIVLLSTDSATGLSVRSTVDGSEIDHFRVMLTTPYSTLHGAFGPDDVVIGWHNRDVWGLRGGELTHVIMPVVEPVRVSTMVPCDDMSVAYMNGRNLFVAGIRDGEVRERLTLGHVDSSSLSVTAADSAGPTIVVTDGVTVEVVTADVGGPGTSRRRISAFDAGQTGEVVVSEGGDEWCAVDTCSGRVEVRGVWDPPGLSRTTFVPGLMSVYHFGGTWRTVRITTEDVTRLVVESLF